MGPNYQVPFAETIKHKVGIPTIAVGLITEPEQAEAIVATGQADMVALARGILYNPRWPWHAAAKTGGPSAGSATVLALRTTPGERIIQKTIKTASSGCLAPA
ncbi:NADPH dehydrogenase [Serratia fonticola]|uniref:NADPH dehydrogenase n=1 Tax=Serratia fonticola TaxID=47917 RepID=A0A4U9VMV9_SERFO|nr:NADPH dehydrogenase [Serratia fonticola]